MKGTPGPDGVVARPVGLGGRRFKAVVSALALVVLFGWVFRGPLFLGNFGVVEPGRVFRSAQPFEPGLSRLLGEYHVASVLNLRGGSPDDHPWYSDEVRVTRERGVDFYDYPLSATRRPSRRELLVLIDFFERCRYPLLIHCKSGSDRTGLASGLYLLSARGVRPELARRAFTYTYGHVGLLGTERLHEPFDEYQAWLEANHLPHTPARFRAWVEHDYRGEAIAGPVPPLRAGPRERRRRP